MKRFETYPQCAPVTSRVIDFKVEYAQSLIDSFSQPEKMPHIAVSVDMLGAGIDIPEVVNLVFFKLVRSKTKFCRRMVGRGTRLSPNLFGSGARQEVLLHLRLLSESGVLHQDPEITEGSIAESLSTKCESRGPGTAIDKYQAGQSESERDGRARTIRLELAERLRSEVGAT